MQCYVRFLILELNPRTELSSEFNSRVPVSLRGIRNGCESWFSQKFPLWDTNYTHGSAGVQFKINVRTVYFYRRPLRPPSPKLSGTRTCRGFMAPNFNVIETSDCYRNLLNDYTTAVGLQEKEHRSKLGHDQCHRLELRTSRRIPKGSAG
ncbi:unnamed protein product [Caenorhabditis auriculariae]|uniref:Uncharacterized protein n=1 Tax=Caenorhabditis auriculariae TaxID=2777116 RepID=A0A8S1HKV6_9PELO|nr:unnamed protein product [Caenorhabditis auriculariae]